MSSGFMWYSFNTTVLQLFFQSVYQFITHSQVINSHSISGSMSSPDDCVLIISHYCHGCHRVVDRLAANSRCPHCRSTRVAEMSANGGGHPLDQTIDLTSDLDDSFTAQTVVDTSGPSARQSLNASVVTCSICLDSLDGNGGPEERTLKCKHRFHTACIDEWFTKEPTCPICRQRVGPEPDVSAPVRQLQHIRQAMVALVASTTGLFSNTVTSVTARNVSAGAVDDPEDRYDVRDVLRRLQRRNRERALSTTATVGAGVQHLGPRRQGFRSTFCPSRPLN